MSGEVRCPGCSRLLGTRSPGGGVVVKIRDRETVHIWTGELSCDRCELPVAVRPLSPPVLRTLEVPT